MFTNVGFYSDVHVYREWEESRVPLTTTTLSPTYTPLLTKQYLLIAILVVLY